MDYLNNYKLSKGYPEKVSFYDLNNDGTPEMILQIFEVLGEYPNSKYKAICDIYTIKNNKLEKIFALENETENTVGILERLDTIIFFTTNNDKNLYYSLQDFDLNNNMTYYKLNYENDKITSNLIGKFETKFFEDLKLRQLNLNSDKYYYNNKQVTENEFLENLNFKQILNTTSLKNIDSVKKCLDNYNNIPANPNYSKVTSQYWNGTDKTFYVNYILYNNGLYQIYEDDTNLLMINGNIIPKANVIVENDNTYLPLRTICNYINKDIIYNNENNSIKIDNISLDLKTSKILSNNTNDKVNIKNINGVTYISSEFFDKYLNFNIYNINKEIMGNNIIYLEDKANKINYTPFEPLKKELNSIEFNNITKTKVNGVSNPIEIGRYYFFKAHIDYYVGNEYLEQFDSEGYFIYDNYSNIKYW